ncbi:FixH family protein [Bacillus rubiinfantis]|uniref:FixH family protein n=1 Tax=Bacillus rubiinfantis TaxID=1499680 RepID=UPI0005AA2C22|nr:FixH family protein [Bacillus rubiinfantis]
MKRTIVAWLLMFTVLVGCSAKPEYKLEVTKDIYVQQDKELPIEVKITEDNKPAQGLKVSAELSMANMDHGTTKVKFTEGKNGVYSGKAKLPMGGKYEAAFSLEKDGKTSEKVIDLNVKKAQGVAKINGEWITNDDVAFYTFINKLQLAMNREAARKQYSGEQLKEELAYLDSQEKIVADQNQLLTQIIRLRSMALLAEEKGHKASDAEVEQAVKKARAQYNQFTSAQTLINEYGADKFWKAEKRQYRMIVLSQMVQKDVTEQVKKENPKAGTQEIQYLAQEKYEQLLISQVNSLKIEIM